MTFGRRGIDLPELDDDEREQDDLPQAIARWVNLAKTHDVVSFSHYRRLRIQYQGWKPVSLAEYRLSLKQDRIAIKKYREEIKRKAHNERVQAESEYDRSPWDGLI